MKKYISKVIIFLLPIVIFILIPSLVLRISGEAFCNIDDAITIGSEKQYILGYAYNGKGTNYEYFKFQKTVKIKPEVLALGSSRVLQFRDYMFKKSFYNAGFTVGTIDDYLTFLKQLPKDYKPEFLILGFDQWMFNESYYNNKEPYPNNIYSLNRSLDTDNGFMNILKVYKEIFNGKINYKNINQKSDTLYFGLNALINKKGFRNDGSFDYGINHQYYKDFDSVNIFFKREIEWIDKGEKYFVYGKNINQSALAKYKELLIYCQDKNINLISFLPPLPNTINNYINESQKYGYLKKLNVQLLKISNNYNAEFYDFTSKEETSVDNEYIDGHHGNELVYSGILSIIGKETNMGEFKNVINSSVLANSEKDYKIKLD